MGLRGSIAKEFRLWVFDLSPFYLSISSVSLFMFSLDFQGGLSVNVFVAQFGFHLTDWFPNFQLLIIKVSPKFTMRNLLSLAEDARRKLVDRAFHSDSKRECYVVLVSKSVLNSLKYHQVQHNIAKLNADLSFGFFARIYIYIYIKILYVYLAILSILCLRYATCLISRKT